MVMVTRPSALVIAAMPNGEPFGIGRIVSRDLAIAFDVTRAHQSGIRERARLGVAGELGAALSVRDRNRQHGAVHAVEEDRRRTREFAPARTGPRTARRDCARSAASCAAPGTISLSAANIWQPLHTPSENVSVALEEALELIARARVIEDGLGPAFARAEHVAVGETAAGHESAEIRERHAARQHVAHVHVVRLETGALQHRGHFHLAVDALLAQHGDPGPRDLRDEGAAMSSFGSKVSATLRPGAPLSQAAANSSRAQPRLIAQLAHAERSLRPGAAQVFPVLVDAAGGRLDAHAHLARGAAEVCVSSPRPCLASTAAPARPARALTCSTTPSSSLNSAPAAPLAPAGSLTSRPQ